MGSEMVREVKTLAAKTDNLSHIPGMVVSGETDSSEFSSDLHMYAVTRPYPKINSNAIECF